MKRLFCIQVRYYISICLLFLLACDINKRKCEILQEWKINNFRIVEKRCPDLVLAYYDKYSVYDEDKSIDGDATRLDSCTFTWQANRETYLTLNICDNTIEEFKPHKIPLEANAIDSVIIYSNELKKTKLLTRFQIEQFTYDWNNSRTRGYADVPFDSAFAGLPVFQFQYKLTVFSKGASRPFYGYNMVFLDSSNWKFEVKRDPTYFHNYWKNAKATNAINNQ